jgi:thiol-disulfide isomerase/thioredoxin
MKKTILPILLPSLLALFPFSADCQPAPFGEQRPMQQRNQFSAQRINWLNNYQEAVSQSQATGKPIVLLFTGTNWCPACMKLEKEVLTTSEFAGGVGGRFIFLKAEFPDYSEEAIKSSPYYPLLQNHGIDTFPPMVIVNANGQRLYTVNYQAGGPSVYINQLLRKFQGAPQ